MFWDPYFGWDTYRMRSVVFWLVAVCLLLSFVTSTEGLGWDYVYVGIYDYIIDHVSQFIMFVIVAMVAIFYYWKVQIGDI
tara:strand:+ start:1487 stop:1726 length:240 start_codon:yes stop_codon:yes gene_type:complete